MTPALPQQDLDAVRRRVGEHWSVLRGQHLLITGGTGIVGKWLLASLLHADRLLGLGCRVTLLSRDPARFAAAQPALAGDARVSLLAGDVRHFQLPAGSRVSHVVHAATDVVDQGPASAVIDTCVQGTLQTIAQARAAGATRLLLLSSGAVYGKTPADMLRIPEDFVGAVDSLAPSSAYGEGKRCSELLGAIASADGDLAVPVARCFAMVGPQLPLDKHFAIGNFIDAVLRGRPIVINGDGTPVRSYLYMADVTAWLWMLLLRGQGGRAYNVGGGEAVSIAALAARVAAALRSDTEIHIARVPSHGAHASHYVPSLARAAAELDLHPETTLDEAIVRTADWYRTALIRR